MPWGDDWAQAATVALAAADRLKKSVQAEDLIPSTRGRDRLNAKKMQAVAMSFANEHNAKIAR